MELKVEGLNLKVRNAWRDKIEEEKERLERHHASLVHNLRVTLEQTSSHKEGGYEVRLIAGVPSETVVVKRRGEAVPPILVEAFDTLGLQLKEFQRKRRKSSKNQEVVGATPAGLGVIKKLSPFESYGFILAADGRDVYFHENSLKGLDLDALVEGDAVTFGESAGDKGPQASWVRAS
ncbi:MAG: HPF/RaiA family ribosome-associated protein [Desulfurivibrionaceae bacterium]|nr:HPF/RaiA family ribosome-associated protein [Desulfurivibrionaceae bacterium]